jgi:hypothetical protein
MKTTLVTAVTAWLAGAGLAFGQYGAFPPAGEAPPDSAKPLVLPATDPRTGPAACGQAGCCPTSDVDNSTIYGSVDYLLWWIKGSPLPASLITTGPVSDNPGALGHGGVPLTGSTQDYGIVSGFRATTGFWLGDGHDLAFEVTGFVLPRVTKTTVFRSNPNGSPVLTFRYLDPPVGGVAAEDAFQASAPAVLSVGPQVGPYSGSVGLTTHSELWGLETNLVGVLAGCRNRRFELLAGFRYVDLEERLDLSFQRQAIAGTGSNVIFLGSPFPAPASVSSLDAFRTRNQFYGGQMGFRGDYCFGKFQVTFTGKVALGDTHEVVNIFGVSTLATGSGPGVTVAGGQFAGPSNIGRSTTDHFSVVPETEISVGYHVTDHLRAFIGYDFLYWSRVVRPGNQVDLIVDTRANPVDPGFTGDRVGFPRSLFNRSDFWAQGINFGLEYRY